MGSYATFSVANQEIFSTKNGIDPLLMSLFRPTDKRIRKETALQVVGLYNREDELKDAQAVTIVEYSSTLSRLRDRLDLMGFTAKHTRRSFERGLIRQRREAVDRLTRLQNEAFDQTYLAFLGERCREEIEVFEHLTFEGWSAGLKRILEKSDDDTLLRNHIVSDEQRSLLDDFPVAYMLQDQSLGDGHFGFPSYDTRVVLRAMCDVLDESAPVIMDLTDLVLGGWYDTDDDLIQEAEYLVCADYQTTQRIIVLTEGGSDKRLIEASMELIYPHLSEYFAFMDFDELNVPGGAGSLVNFVKAFAAAGVINRLVAVFDNDTAGALALRSLTGLTLPPNIAVTQLPVLADLREYPTVGPTGNALSDINGLAASIELYFGRDVLGRGEASLAPVQWKGFDRVLNRYHGEIVEKQQLQGLFLEKLERARANPSELSSADWAPMRSVLDTVRTAVSTLGPLDGVFGSDELDDSPVFMTG